MKHAVEDGVLQTNLLQAFQKNKLIQSKLNERERSYYVQLIKNMQDHKLKEKLNKELLYSWKKEGYVRHLKKNLQEYERKRFGVRDAYYNYQARNLDCVITGQQGLVIPPSEEERRLNVNAKLHQFLENHPLQRIPPIRVVKSVNIPIEPVNKEKEKEEEDVRGVEDTWKHIHAQSAVSVKRKKRNLLPSIQRSLTMDVIKRTQPLPNALAPLTSDVVVSTIPGTILPEVVNTSSEGRRQPTKASTTHSTIAEDLEPVIIESETLKKQTRSDLVAMRSVRRPQKNPIDLNILFESRKRMCQINKRFYDYRLCQRKCSLQHNSQFDRPQQTDPIDDEENALVEMSDSTRQRYEDRHQADKNFI